jgi:putative flippase GtrA
VITRLWQVRFLRFLVVGGLNTVFGFSVYAVLITLGLHYVLALLIAQIIGVLFNFIVTGLVVFGNRNPRLLVRFMPVYVVTYTLNVVGVALLGSAGVDPLWAGAILILPVAVAAFALQKRFVFNA